MTIKSPLSSRMRLALSVLSVVALAGAYEVLSSAQHARNPSDTTMPSLRQMTKAVVQIVTPDEVGRIWLWEDFTATFSRHAAGLICGAFLSVILGIAMGCFSMVEAVFLPPLSFFAKVPSTAMLAVFFILTGTGMTMFTAMIAFGVLPTLTQAIYQTVKYDVHEELIHKAYTLGATSWEVITCVIFDSILPRLLEAVRLQIGPAMVCLIAAEYAMADVGFGFRLRLQSRQLNMAVVYDYLLVLGAMGFIMDHSMCRLREYLCPWFDVRKGNS